VLGGTRSGFTLVEVLIVIAIIGVLVGLLIPAVNMARRAVQQAAIAFEVEALANAIEQYKNKYGDYPPDGSNRATFERHFRKAFSGIAATEFAVLRDATVANSSAVGPDAVMDPAEALVFCLGGFSSDPARPFTGPGGPFAASGSGLQYNVDRTNAFFEFKQTQLSIKLDASGTATVSNDEEELFGSSANDLLPVYRPGGQLKAPFVYFDSRTYSFAVGSGTYFNSYNPANVEGVARPYKSDQKNTSVNAATNPDQFYRYVNDRSFQIISAGLDDSYGGVAALRPNDTPVFFMFPTGESLDIGTGNVGDLTQYKDLTGLPSTQLDNATNFSDGILGNALP
jgi:prepilin-type N-terminal cleavage/methylation domain-containing protein